MLQTLFSCCFSWVYFFWLGGCCFLFPAHVFVFMFTFLFGVRPPTPQKIMNVFLKVQEEKKIKSFAEKGLLRQC